MEDGGTMVELEEDPTKKMMSYILVEWQQRWWEGKGSERRVSDEADGRKNAEPVGC